MRFSQPAAAAAVKATMSNDGGGSTGISSCGSCKDELATTTAATTSKRLLATNRFSCYRRHNNAVVVGVIAHAPLLFALCFLLLSKMSTAAVIQAAASSPSPSADWLAETTTIPPTEDQAATTTPKTLVVNTTINVIPQNATITASINETPQNPERAGEDIDKVVLKQDLDFVDNNFETSRTDDLEAGIRDDVKSEIQLDIEAGSAPILNVLKDAAEPPVVEANNDDDNAQTNVVASKQLEEQQQATEVVEHAREAKSLEVAADIANDGTESESNDQNDVELETNNVIDEPQDENLQPVVLEDTKNEAESVVQEDLANESHAANEQNEEEGQSDDHASPTEAEQKELGEEVETETPTEQKVIAQEQKVIAEEEATEQKELKEEVEAEVKEPEIESEQKKNEEELVHEKVEEDFAHESSTENESDAEIPQAPVEETKVIVDVEAEPETEEQHEAEEDVLKREVESEEHISAVHVQEVHEDNAVTEITEVPEQSNVEKETKSSEVEEGKAEKEQKATSASPSVVEETYDSKVLVENELKTVLPIQDEESNVEINLRANIPNVETVEKPIIKQPVLSVEFIENFYATEEPVTKVNFLSLEEQGIKELQNAVASTTLTPEINEHKHQIIKKQGVELVDLEVAAVAGTEIADNQLSAEEVDEEETPEDDRQSEEDVHVMSQAPDKDSGESIGVVEEANSNEDDESAENVESTASIGLADASTQSAVETSSNPGALSSKGSRSVNTPTHANYNTLDDNAAATLLESYAPRDAGQTLNDNLADEHVGSHNDNDVSTASFSGLVRNRSTLIISLCSGTATLFIILSLIVFLISFRRQHGTLDIEMQEQRCGKDNLDEEDAQHKLLDVELPVQIVTSGGCEETDECL